MKIVCCRQTFTEQTDRRTKICIYWAPVGDKKFDIMRRCCCQAHVPFLVHSKWFPFISIQTQRTWTNHPPNSKLFLQPVTPKPIDWLLIMTDCSLFILCRQVPWMFQLLSKWHPVLSVYNSKLCGFNLVINSMARENDILEIQVLNKSCSFYGD